MNKKNAAIALVILNITSLAALIYMGFRYVTESDMTHQSFVRAQERARLAGAANAIPQLNSDYIDFLREQNVQMLTASRGGFGFILLGNTVWIFLNRKPPKTRAG